MDTTHMMILLLKETMDSHLKMVHQLHQLWTENEILQNKVKSLTEENEHLHTITEYRDFLNKTHTATQNEFADFIAELDQYLHDMDTKDTSMLQKLNNNTLQKDERKNDDIP